MKLRYQIHSVSAMTLLGYGEHWIDRYRFRLNESETKRCIIRADDEQEDNALFYQIMCVLHDGKFPELENGSVCKELSDVIFFMDFSGIFDRGNGAKALERQQKARDMFRSAGVELDFGTGPKQYVAFERSNSMSRHARLTFIDLYLYNRVRDRIMLDMEVSNCQLSKLYAYNGLMLSSGVRIDGIDIEKPHRVIVVDNPKLQSEPVDVITVEPVEEREGVKRYRRVEKKMPLTVTEFDGEGLVSAQYAKKLNEKYGDGVEHHSFQIRMPFIKGMIHEVDFKDLLPNAGGETITDIWGEKHPIKDVDVILTKSMFKGYGWLTENKMSWRDYWTKFKKYDHALYISNVGWAEPEQLTELNYQFLTTLSMTAEEFRPADLPKGWDHSPAEDARHWITKTTEQRYYDLCCNEKYRLSVFTREKSRRARILKKNPLFLHEPAFIKQLNDMAEKTLKNYAVGRLLVAGDVRFLSGDLLQFVEMLLQDPVVKKRRTKGYYSVLKGEHFGTTLFYAPGAAYESDGVCTILRNPHISRNEEIRLQAYDAKKEKDRMWDWYLHRLTSVVMVDSRMLAAERLGGADFDGDEVKTIADPLVNRCVQRNYDGGIENSANLPLLYIPAEEPVIRDAQQWTDRYLTVRDTFSSRVGQISNAAFDRSVIAYSEKADPDERERCRQDVEALTILTGLEIDSAKSGVKPDLDEYLKQRRVTRSPFITYKNLLEDKPHSVKKRKELLRKTDWSKVTSNVERLPLYAMELLENTPKLKTTPAKDEELFSFAVPGWKDALDGELVSSVASLLRDYEVCLNRIFRCRLPIAERKREGDIHRVLFSRGQEDQYDVETLYATFSGLDPVRVEELRRSIREQDWYLMRRPERMAFLEEQLPDYEEWHDLFADFRFGGYRVLGDLICDIDDANHAEERKQFHRDSDSISFTYMMNAYEEKPFATTYQKAVADACRTLLNELVEADEAVKYVVAAGYRRFLFDLLEDRIEAVILTPDRKVEKDF